MMRRNSECECKEENLHFEKVTVRIKTNLELPGMAAW